MSGRRGEYMKYIMYLDVFFAINFFMDLIILVIAGKFIKPQTTIKRCLLAALAGATLTCIITVWKFPTVILQKIFTYVVISAVMTGISYRLKNVAAYFKAIATIYVVSFTMAGAINALYYFTNVGFYINKILSFEYLRGMNIVTFICITVIGYFITDFFSNYILKRFNKNIKGNDIYDVELMYRGNQIAIKGLYDSGNSLREPIGGTPVHIAEYDVITKILEGVEANEAKIRIVPYKSIGTGKGVLTAIEIDKLRVGAEGEFIEINKVMIGIYEGSLSTHGAYQIILNRSINKWL